jgi:hypothetical protein
VVERGPEKAGVGGSIPSLATTSFNNLATTRVWLRGKAGNSREQFDLAVKPYWTIALLKFGIAEGRTEVSMRRPNAFLFATVNDYAYLSRVILLLEWPINSWTTFTFSSFAMSIALTF